MSAARLLRVCCATWDQVESFYQRKLRKSGRMVMRVPFAAEIGTPVTLALELPSQIVIAIDGTISVAGDGGRVEVTLFGMTASLLAQLEAMVRAGRDHDLLDEDTADDERRLLAAREGDLRRMRQLGAHELLGVPRDPSALELRAAWIAIARREHPDAVARYSSPALTAAAEASMALVGRAYDCLRAEVVAGGRGASIAATVRPLVGWNVGLADLAQATGFFAEAVTPPIDAAIDVLLEVSNASLPVVDRQGLVSARPLPTAPSREVPVVVRPAGFAPAAPDRAASEAGPDGVELPAVGAGPPRPPSDDLTLPPLATPVAVRFGSPSDLFNDLAMPTAAGVLPIALDESLAQARSGPGDRFLRQIRERLGVGDHGSAQQIAEAALHLYAGDRRLRGLQHVAMAMAACSRNDRLAAVAALETALSHDPASAEAAQALDTVRRAITPTVLAMQRLFR